MVALPSLEDLAALLAARHPLPSEFIPLISLHPLDPDAGVALRAILGSARNARVRLRQVSRSLGDQEAVASDTAASLQQYGYRRVHAAALTALVVAQMDFSTNVLDAVSFWRRAVCTMFGTALLIPDQAPESAVAAATGLLHEIGFFLLDIERPDLTALVTDQAGRTGGLHPDVERAVLGFALHELTAVVISRWGLPASIVTAVLERERGPLERGRLGTALWAASDGTVSLGLGGPLYPSRRELDPKLHRAVERFFGSANELLGRVDRVLAGVMLDRSA